MNRPEHQTHYVKNHCRLKFINLKAIKNNFENSHRRAVAGNTPGFTLVECLIGLSLTLFILLSSIEIFNLTRRIFLKFETEKEISLAAANALEKIREDAEKAGRRLEIDNVLSEAKPSDFYPIVSSDAHLFLFSQDEELFLESPAIEGQNYIRIKLNESLVEKVKKGKSLLLCQQSERKLEIFSITNLTGNCIYLNARLGFDYLPENSTVSLLEKVDYFLDRKQKILRRRVNDTTAQPLLENTLDFSSRYSPDTNILSVRFIAGEKKEKSYELVIFPKNIFKNRWL